MLLGSACDFEIPASATPQPVLVLRVLHRVSVISKGLTLSHIQSSTRNYVQWPSICPGERREQYFDDILVWLDKNGLVLSRPCYAG